MCINIIIIFFIRWRDKTESVVTLERFFSYYTQTSAHLAPGYNYYSRNCQHFVVAVVKLLKQMQDYDLGSEATVGSFESKDSGGRGGLGHTLLMKLLQILGAEE